MVDAIWICPVCKAPLSLSGKQWQCSNGHSYDQAKAGYVNLLLANQKSSAEPGDNKMMMQARRAFLAQGHYLPLANSLRKLIEPVSASTLTLHDAGCGEGYYLGQLVAGLHNAGRTVLASGNDISRSAITLAAKQYRELPFAVASNFNLPLASDSKAVVLQVFAPASAAEVHRVLIPGGLWIQVTPAADHLAQLRAALYASPQEHKMDAAGADGFAAAEPASLRFELSLPDRDSRENLLMMTPYYWRADSAVRNAVLDSMANPTAAFSLRVLRKQGEN